MDSVGGNLAAVDRDSGMSPAVDGLADRDFVDMDHAYIAVNMCPIYSAYPLVADIVCAGVDIDYDH